MISETVTLIVGLLTALTLASGLVGVAVRLILLPWLQKHIAEPVKETQRQVTVNRHVSTPPTLLDKIDHVARDVAQVRSEITAAAAMFEGHIGLSGEDRANIWAAIHELKKGRLP